MRHGMRVLVLGHELDPTVNAVVHALAERHGASAVHHLDLARLAHARWQHRVESDGKVATRLHLGGRDDAVFDVVFDRSEPLAALPFRGWSDAERTYGRSEWLALLLGWLRSLGDRVVNRPSLGCLNGPADRAWPWLARAAAAGLVPHPCGATTSARALSAPDGALEHPALRPEAGDDAPAGEPRVFAYATPAAAIVDAIVVGDEVFADAAADGARKLFCASPTARAPTCSRSACAQTRGDPTWRFVAADPAPVLDAGAPLAALVRLLERRGGVP